MQLMENYPLAQAAVAAGLYVILSLLPLARASRLTKVPTCVGGAITPEHAGDLFVERGPRPHVTSWHLSRAPDSDPPFCQDQFCQGPVRLLRLLRLLVSMGATP